MKLACVIPSIGRDSLYRSVESAINQSVPFDQIFVVFDVPEDNISCFSSKLCESVRCLYTGGGRGGTFARQLGYSKAEADYVCFLDDDDLIYGNFVAAFKEAARSCGQRFSLALPEVHKVWTEGRIPSQVVVPIKKRYAKCDAIDITEVVRNGWMPSTSSGMIIKKSDFEKLPVNVCIPGFNDVQMVRGTLNANRKIVFMPELKVIFNQYFSSGRLTSSLESRMRAIKDADSLGFTFSEREKEAIVVSAIYSQARGVAFNQGVFHALKELFVLLRLNKNYRRSIAGRIPLLLLQIGVFFWLGLTRWLDKDP